VSKKYKEMQHNGGGDDLDGNLLFVGRSIVVS
jgi:hypothetical protein